MRNFQNEMGMAIMFITHDLGVIAQMAERVVVMYLGKVVEVADIDTIFYNAMHPYTQALLRSIPRLRIRQKTRTTAWRLFAGLCPILTICRRAAHSIRAVPAHLRCMRCARSTRVEVEAGHMVRCVYISKINGKMPY